VEFDLAVLGVVIGFMVLANRLVAALVTPLFERYGWDHFALMYIAWAIAGVFVWLSGVNLFTAYIPDVLIGKILTAVVAGGGSNLLHDLVDRPAEIWVPLEGDDEEFEPSVEGGSGNEEFEPSVEGGSGNVEAKG